MNKNDKIYLAGHVGMVGSAIFRQLQKNGFDNIVTKDLTELDLTNQSAVDVFFQTEKPDYVFLAAARVGGIYANNTYPAEFIYQNLMIQTNVINSAFKNKVKKLLFLGSSCIYPKNSPQPIKEEYFLDGKLEPTNEPYAIAKIAGIKMCQAYNRQYATNYISLMPTNLYGPNDNYHLENSHVLPALIRKFHEAKINGQAHTEIWGTGEPKREFLFVDDLARAALFLMQNYQDSEIINIGTGEDLTIRNLALLIKDVIGFQGDIKFDATKPDGMKRKLLDVSKLKALGWQPEIDLKTGIALAYEDFLKRY